MIEIETKKFRPTENKVFRSNKQKNLQYRDTELSSRHGIRVINKHTVLQFKQSPWLSQYIKYNTEQKSKVKHEKETHFYKKMNIFYTKTIKNIGKHLSFDLIDKRDTH